MPRGRPSKLTPQTQKKICDAISQGNYRQVAAEWAGITYRIFYDWMKKGRSDSSGKYCDFFHAVVEAEKAAEIRCVGLVMEAAANDARHAEWWLERKAHKRWGRKDRLETKGEHKISGTVTHSHELTYQQRLLALAALRASVGNLNPGSDTERNGFPSGIFAGGLGDVDDAGGD